MRSAPTTLALVALVALAAPVVASADVTVSLDRASARPGQVVRATSSSCCYLSLYLVPATRVPQPHSCRMRNGVMATCEPWSVGPPHRRGWVWLGRFFPKRSSFVFHVPPVRPGLYRPVIYCAPCYRGPRGSLIAGSQALRVVL
jgi:hypothetical protein